MATTQRVPTVARQLVGGESGRDALRRLRGVELACQTRDDAEQLADLIAGLLPEPMSGRLALIELLLNAIEHGNLEIGGELKGRLLREQRFEEELEARMAVEPFRSRRARLEVVEVEPMIQIEIRDDGPGFAWRTALAADLQANGRPNGRGIALVRNACSPRLAYRDPGNVAILRFLWPR